MMGWRPWEVRAAAVPEFLATLDGFAEFNNGDNSPEPATRADLESLMAQYPD